MSNQWFYAHDENRIGPYSDQQLRALADAGAILPTDTVWKEGIKEGILASRVKNLFAVIEVAALPHQPVEHERQPPVTAPSVPAPEPIPVEPTSANKKDVAASADAPAPLVHPKLTKQEVSPPSSPVPNPRQSHVRKARAVAGKGTTIVGQDGTYVQVRKKCTVCGQENSSRSNVMIRSGLNKVSFFCPKCKRRREAEFQGVTT